MASQNLTAQNSSYFINVSRARSQVATLATAAATAAGADFVCEAEVRTSEWVPVGLFDAVLQEAVDSITGPSQYAWTDIPSATRVRVRRTDANGGNGTVDLNTIEV